MELTSPSYTYHGSNLLEAINTVHPERKALIENLLYEKSALLLFADDGVGKSILTLQACMQATVKDAKVFGEFLVPQDNKILYFQMERHPDESFERMRYMIHTIPFNNENFALSVALQGINLQNEKSYATTLIKLMDVIGEIGFIPSIIVFDPIYTLAQGGLETAEACNAITNFFRTIQIQYNCTILATSHTNRGVRDKDNPSSRVGKDMYGNRFLSAFFTGSYHIEGKPDGAGTIWTRGKNSQTNLEKKIDLMYDGANHQSVYLSDGKFSKVDRLMNYLKACGKQEKEFSFDDMIENSGMSPSYLRRQLSSHLEQFVKESSKLSRGKLLYRYFE